MSEDGRVNPPGAGTERRTSFSAQGAVELGSMDRGGRVSFSSTLNVPGSSPAIAAQFCSPIEEGIAEGSQDVINSPFLSVGAGGGMKGNLSDVKITGSSVTVTNNPPPVAARISSNQLRSVLRVNMLEETVYSVAYITVKNNDIPHWASWLLEIVEDLQLLGFGFDSHRLPDMPGVLSWLLSPTVYLKSDFSQFSLANGIALVIVFCTMLLAIYVGLQIHRLDNVPILALRCLRILFSLLMTLSVSISELMMGGLNFRDHTVNISTAPMGLVLAIFDALGLVIFVPLMLVGALVFLESSPDSLSPHAKAHGRMDFRTTLMRFIFVALVSFMQGINSDIDLVSILIMVAGLLYLFFFVIWSRPYYNQQMTNLKAGFYLASAGSANASLISTRLNVAGGWLTIVTPTAIVCFVFGWACSEFVARRQLDRTILAWQTWQKQCGKFMTALPFDEPWTSPTVPVNDMKQLVGMFVVPSSRRGSVAPVSSSELSLQNQNQSPTSLRVPPHPALGTIVEEDKFMKSLDGIYNTPEVLKIAKDRPKSKKIQVFSSSLHVEATIRFLHREPSLDQTILALHLIQCGLTEFPDDCMMLFFASGCLQSFYGDSGAKKADELIDEIKRRRPAFDVKFMVYAKERDELDQRKVASAAGGEQLRVLESAEYQNLDRQARQQHLQALQAVRDFWEAVRIEKHPPALSAVISRLSIYSTGADSCYSRLLAKFPTSKNIMRAYAIFLTSVRSEQLKAGQLIDMAEDVESKETKDFAIPTVVKAPPLLKPSSTEDELVPEPGVPFDDISDRPAFDNAELQKVVKPGFPGSPGSHTSGTSLSKQARQGIQSRKLLLLRISEPVLQKPLINGAIFLFLASLVAGFVMCFAFFDLAVSSMGSEFAMAKASQLTASNVLEGLHRVMVLSFWNTSASSYMTTLNGVQNDLTTLLTTTIPFVSGQGRYAGAVYRIFTPVMDPTTGAFDYSVSDVSTSDMMNYLARAASFMLRYPTIGGLTVQQFCLQPETRLINDNVLTFLGSLQSLSGSGVDMFLSQLASKQVVIFALLGITVVTLIIINYILYMRVLRHFSQIEHEIMRTMRSVPKRIAAALVSQIEEDIETFREVSGSEELEDLNSKLLPDSEKLSDGDGDEGMLSRFVKYLGITFVVLAALACAMFIVTLGSMSVKDDMARAVSSNQRIFHMQAFRLLLRSLLFPGSPMIPLITNIEGIRGTLADLKNVHMSLIGSGLNGTFPILTVNPRNCTAGSIDPCANLSFSTTSGFTPLLASSAMNDEINRFLEVSDAVTVQAMESALAYINATSNAASVPQFTITNPLWTLVNSISNDVISRLQALDTAVTGSIGLQIGANRNLCAILFGVTLGLALVAALLLHHIGLRKLRYRAVTLSSLFFLLPTGYLKDVPRIQRIIESGGALLLRDDT